MQTSKIALGLVQHAFSPIRLSAKDRWTCPSIQPVWTVDYCDWDGLRCKVDTGTGPSEPFERPKGSWHVYAPGVRYWECNSRPEKRKEDLWFFFESKKAVPGIAQRPFTIFLDPEERIAQRVRWMYQLQQRGEPGDELILHGLLLSILGEMEVASHQTRQGDSTDPWTITGPQSDPKHSMDRLLPKVDQVVSGRLKRPPPPLMPSPEN